jgi:hypothetical protein
MWTEKYSNQLFLVLTAKYHQRWKDDHVSCCDPRLNKQQHEQFSSILCPTYYPKHSESSISCKLACVLCFFICLPRLLDVVNSMSQMSHLYGFSMLCVLIWIISLWYVTNRNIQPGRLQTCLSRPLCQRMCALIWDGLLNAFPHPGSWHL